MGTEETWAELARRVKYRVSGLGPSYGRNRLWLWRYWKRECRCTPKEWLQEERWRAAKRLVEQGNRASKVAKLLGYANASHFTSDFKARTGRTAHRYYREVRYEAHLERVGRGGGASRRFPAARYQIQNDRAGKRF
jgi:methylphosphotriester-DNA--protein-cysteine methyltransferase